MQLQFKNNSTLKSTKKERKKAIFQESEGPPQVPKINQQICAENARGIYENIMTGNPEEIKTALLSFPFLFCNEITARCPTPEIVDIIFNFSLSQDSDVAYPALACICTIFETFPEVREFLFAREFYTQMPRFFNENDMLWHISILWDLDPRIMQYLISSGLIPFIIQNIQQSELDYFKQALELYTKLLNKEVPEAIEQVRELLLHLTFDQKSKKQVDSLNFLYAALPIVEEDLRNASFFDVFIPKILSFEANELSVAFSIVERISYFQEYAIYLYNKDIISIIHALFTMEEEFSQPNPRVSSLNILANIAHLGIDYIKPMLSTPIIDDILCFFRQGQYEERLVAVRFITELIKYVTNYTEIQNFIYQNDILEILMEILQTNYDQCFVDILEAFHSLYEKHSITNLIIEELDQQFVDIYFSDEFIETLQNIQNMENVEEDQNFTKLQGMIQTILEELNPS